MLEVLTRRYYRIRQLGRVHLPSRPASAAWR